MNKRASLMDSVLVPIYLLIVGVTIVVALYVWSTFSTNFLIATADAPGASIIAQAVSDIQVSLQGYDYMFPFIIGGLLLASIIFAYKTGANVLYAAASLILWAFAMLLSVIITNVFGEFETVFPTVAASIPIIAYSMDNMRWIVLAWLALISLVMFTRDKKDDRQLAAMESVYG